MNTNARTIHSTAYRSCNQDLRINSMTTPASNNPQMSAKKTWWAGTFTAVHPLPEQKVPSGLRRLETNMESMILNMYQIGVSPLCNRPPVRLWYM